MLYSKKWIFTFILRSWSAKLPYTKQSNGYRQRGTKHLENLKKYCEFTFSSRSELTVGCEGKRNAFLLCPICTLSPYWHSFNNISFKTSIKFCDDQSHSVRLLHNSGHWRKSKILFIQWCFGVLQVLLQWRLNCILKKKGNIQSR